MDITTVTQRVDVRDMLCAQAIGVVWRVAGAIPNGGLVEIICNAADVKQDLLIWANELGHAILSVEDRAEETWLWIRKMG